MLTTLWKITLGAGSILKSFVSFLGNKVSNLFGNTPVTGILVLANILIFFFCNSGYMGLKDSYIDLIWASFSHSGLPHLAFNMALLYICGTKVESVLGSRRFTILYTMGVIGALFGYFSIFVDNYYMGASGALLAVLSVYPFVQRSFGGTVLSGLIIGATFYIDFFGFVESLFQPTGIAEIAHIAGGVSGLITYCFFHRK